MKPHWSILAHKQTGNDEIAVNIQAAQKALGNVIIQLWLTNSRCQMLGQSDNCSLFPSWILNDSLVKQGTPIGCQMTIKA